MWLFSSFSTNDEIKVDVTRTCCRRKNMSGYAKLYFRSSLISSFFGVDMTRRDATNSLFSRSVNSRKSNSEMEKNFYQRLRLLCASRSCSFSSLLLNRTNFHSSPRREESWKFAKAKLSQLIYRVAFLTCDARCVIFPQGDENSVNNWRRNDWAWKQNNVQTTFSRFCLLLS